ncbi:MAG: hypothetical protein WC821_03760 [archaeon]|jgi:hypothetical protein
MNPNLMKNSANRRILATTLKFQRKFPEIHNGVKLVGRMDVRARGKHIQEIAKIFIKDKELFDLIVGEQAQKLDPSQQRKLIANWAKRKTKTHSEAIELLEKIKNDILSSNYNEKMPTDINELKKISKIKKLNKTQQEDFLIHTNHTAGTGVFVILPPLFEAINFLKGQ